MSRGSRLRKTATKSAENSSSNTTISRKTIKTAENQDISPLSIFITQDIKKGEVLIVNKYIIGISNVPLSRLLYYNTYYTFLYIPYIYLTRVIKLSYYSKVIFYSYKYYNITSKGYYKVVYRKHIN